MSPREGMYYVGLMGGIIIGVGISRMFGWHHFIGLGLGLVIGLGLGVVSQTLFDRARAGGGTGNRPLPGGGDLGPNAVKCHKCKWIGDPGAAVFCPVCGERLRDR